MLNRMADQITTKMIRRQVDLKQVYCRACGKMLRRDRLDRHDQIVCHRCANVNIFPHDFADRVRHDLTFGS